MTVTEHVPDHVWTVDEVLSADECAQWIAWSEAQGFDSAPVTTGMGFVHLPSVRNNTRVMVDNPDFAALLWDRLRPHLPATRAHGSGLPAHWEALGLNERLRIYRYDPGQYFKRHRDGAFRRSSTEASLFTLMVYLNDDFEGGGTSFGDWEIRPKTGMALAFEHRIKHAGETVTRGRKYALRTDVMYTLHAGR